MIISNELFALISQQPNVEEEHLYKEIRKDMNVFELGEAFQNANIIYFEEAAELVAKIAKNIETFIDSYSEFIELSESERYKRLTEAITSMLYYNKYSTKSKLGPCEDARPRVVQDAGESILSVATIQAVVVMCEGDVQSDYRACIL